VWGTIDIPQTALVATLDTYDFNDLYFYIFLEEFFFGGASPGSAGCFKKPTQIPNAGHPIYIKIYVNYVVKK
jgi:hypothetical protein